MPQAICSRRPHLQQVKRPFADVYQASISPVSIAEGFLRKARALSARQPEASLSKAAIDGWQVDADARREPGIFLACADHHSEFLIPHQINDLETAA